MRESINKLSLEARNMIFDELVQIALTDPERSHTFKYSTAERMMLVELFKTKHDQINASIIYGEPRFYLIEDGKWNNEPTVKEYAEAVKEFIEDDKS